MPKPGKKSDRQAGNGRAVRNILERAKRNQATTRYTVYIVCYIIFVAILLSNYIILYCIIFFCYKGDCCQALRLQQETAAGKVHTQTDRTVSPLDTVSRKDMLTLMAQDFDGCLALRQDIKDRV